MNFQENTPYVTNELLQLMRDGKDLYVSWKSDKEKMKKNNESYCLDRDLVKVILKKLDKLNVNDCSQGYLIEEYKQAITKTDDGTNIILHAHPCFQGKKWYNWAYVHFEELNASGVVVETYYPAKIIGFITLNGITEAVIHCSDKQLNWTDVNVKFIVKTILGTTFDVLYITVPVLALVDPLCVIPDYGSDGTSFIVVSPKHNWSSPTGHGSWQTNERKCPINAWEC